MSYAVVGAGAIGSALASQFFRQRIAVLLANRRGPESLSDLVTEFSPYVTAAPLTETVRADVVILAVPFAAVRDVARGTDNNWEGRIVVDATNAIDFPAFKPADLGGRLSTEIVAELVRGAGVVKAFNTIPATLLRSPPEQGIGRRVVFLSGDDPRHNAEIAGLVSRLGFAPLDLGKISEGGRLQQFGGPLPARNLFEASSSL